MVSESSWRAWEVGKLQPGDADGERTGRQLECRQAVDLHAFSIARAVVVVGSLCLVHAGWSQAGESSQARPSVPPLVVTLSDIELSAMEFESICGLPAETLSISGATIPRQAWHHLARMESLRVLGITNTSLEDEAVTAIGSLGNLRRLQLSRTRYPEGGWQSLLSTLRERSIDWSPLSGLNKLERLRVNFGRWDDDAVEALGQLTALQSLILPEAYISERGARALGNLHRLELLSIAEGTIDDAHLEHLDGLHDLERLILPDSRVTGAGLAALAGLDELAEVDLTGSRVDDAGMAGVGELPSLARLQLRDTSVTGAGLRHLKGCVNLVRLDLSSTAVGDDGVESLVALKSLEHLALRGTRLSDEGLAQLTALPSLRRLSIVETAVSEAGAAAFQEVRPDVELFSGASSIEPSQHD